MWHKTTMYIICSVWSKDGLQDDHLLLTAPWKDSLCHRGGREPRRRGEAPSRVCTHGRKVGRAPGGPGILGKEPGPGRGLVPDPEPQGGRPQSRGGPRGHCSHFAAPLLSKCTKVNNLISTPNIRFNFPNILLLLLKNNVKFPGVLPTGSRDVHLSRLRPEAWMAGAQPAVFSREGLPSPGTSSARSRRTVTQSLRTGRPECNICDRPTQARGGHTWTRAAGAHVPRAMAAHRRRSQGWGLLISQTNSLHATPPSDP